MVYLTSDDPLAFVLAPPPDESPEAKTAREDAEAKARRVSECIDMQLEQERRALKEKTKPVKLLLLGQSESDRATILKNFQLRLARENWEEDKAAWRLVIFLNLIHNVIDILDTLLHDMSVCFTVRHRLSRLRFAPLRRVLADVEKRFGLRSQGVYSSTPVDSTGQDRKSEVPSCEIGVIARDGWKSALEKLRQVQEEIKYEITNTLIGCKEDMKSFWNDPGTRKILAQRKADIEDAPGFFLNDVERIVSPDYEPSDDDIFRARLQTVGIQEHKFFMEEGIKLIIYDIGDIRSSPAVWASYFDDVDSIIFLCPIACFDETLPEDPRINRLEDSYRLWRSICSSPIFARIQIILFFTKCDSLHDKLQRGVRIRDYVPTFGDQKNDAVTVMKHFQTRFKNAFKSISRTPQPLRLNFVSVIDTKTIGTVCCAVKDSIIRSHLTNENLL